jgi:hypothetical protein
LLTSFEELASDRSHISSQDFERYLGVWCWGNASAFTQRIFRAMDFDGDQSTMLIEISLADYLQYIAAVKSKSPVHKARLSFRLLGQAQGWLSDMEFIRFMVDFERVWLWLTGSSQKQDHFLQSEELKNLFFRGRPALTFN